MELIMLRVFINFDIQISMIFVFLLPYFFVSFLIFEAKASDNMPLNDLTNNIKANEDDLKNDEVFRGLIKQFFGVNPKMRSVISFMRSNLGAKAINVSKNISITVNTARELGKEDEFSTPRLDFKAQFSPNTFFEIKEAGYIEKEARYSSRALKEAEQITIDFMYTLISYNLNLEFAKYVEKYILECRKDAKEGQIKAKHNDISLEEKAQFEAKLAEAEVSYAKLQSDISTSKKLLNLFFPLNNEEDKHDQDFVGSTFGLHNLEGLISFEKISLPSVGLLESEYALKKAKNSFLKNIASFAPFPYVTLNANLYLSDPKTRKNQIKQEKDKLSIEVGVNLSPSKFFEIHKAQCDYEHAKNNFVWEKSKYDFDKLKAYNRLMLEKTSLKSAKSELRSKKLSLDTALAQYSAGEVVYSKVANARRDYYFALERYYKVAKECALSTLEYMKLTGKIRQVFIDLIDQEIGV